MSSQSITSEHVAEIPHIQAIAQPGQYLTFVLGGEAFALGILNIKEIIDYGNVTEVPMMPEFIRGVINLRGRGVPVIDLSARFGRASTQIGKRTGIVIVETTSGGLSEHDAFQQDLGIIVDAVNEVVDIGRDDIEPAPTFGARIRQDFISGMAKRNGRFIILLNVNRVLSMDEFAVLKQVGIEGHQ